MKGAALLLIAVALTASPATWAHRLVTPVSKASLPDSAQTCEACLVVGRVLSDYLCDFDFVGWLVQSVAEVVCKSADDEQCDQTVSVLLPLAVEYARTTATPDALCFFAGLCNSGSAAATAHPAAALLHMHANRAGCAECRYVAAAIKGAQSGGSADAAAKQACAALPRELAASCSTLTENAGGLLQRFSGFDRACELSGPCAWSALDAMFGGLQGTPSPALQQLGQVLRSAQQQQPLLSLPTDASTCDKCKLTVLEVRMLVHSVTVQQEIVNITRLVCDHLAPYEEMCRSTIDTYAPAAFGLIDKYLQPDTVCGNLLQLCPIKQRQQVRLVAAQRHGSAWQTVLWKLQEMWQMPSKAEA